MRRATAARSEHDETRRTTVDGQRKFPSPRSIGTMDLSEPGRSFTRTNRSTRMQMEKELKLLSNQARFISAIISGEIKYIQRKMKELLQDIMDKGFDPILIVREGSLPVPDDEGEAAAAGESPDEQDPSSCYYEYLTSMPMRFFNDEYLQQHLLKRISEIKEAMTRSSHTKHMDAQSDREATGNDCVPQAAATTPTRRCKRSAAESVPIDDDANDEEAAAQLYDYLAAIVGLGPQQRAEPGTVSIQRRPTKKKRRMKSSVVGALLPLEDINIAASASTGTDDAWTSRPAVPYSLSTLGFARSI
ncbi:hypothetical protein CFC21_020426 [Triticum aestivum]|uniref:Uncharacterized protein n=2 Tax=Triticum aestivum TaxID=4565 RepID=A0A9R1E8V6_WHEAT|nr:DNA topoisomerase 2-like [Triticum aestivum]KAF7005297.1 hypothetical protein CFC21_020426 [Triticum aestivum]